MKNWITLVCFFMAAMVLAPSAVRASQQVSAKDMRKEFVKKVSNQKDALKKGETELKASGALKGGKLDIDFKNDPERWLWFGLSAMAIAILLSILFWGGVFFLPGLFWTVGIICLFVWVVKKFL